MTEDRKASKRKRRWSQHVTETSDAMTLEKDVFGKPAPEIATSLKHSAERSRRRKASPFQSAMSMLTFYINRAGKQLSRTDKRRVENAKGELRRLFGRK